MKNTAKQTQSSLALVALCGSVMTVAALAATSPTLRVAEASKDDYELHARPVLEKYCAGCHGEAKQKGDVRFDQVDPDMVNGPDVELWSLARDLLNGGDMPPRKSEQPTTEERRALLAWLNASLEEAARAHEGERAPVMRRLNKAQYTN